jgi:hypothetical protein
MADQSWVDYYDEANFPLVPAAERRDDILLEQLFTSDASGLYVGNWISTRDVLRVRVAAHFLDAVQSPSAELEEAMLDTSSSPRVIREAALAISSGPDRIYQEVDLTARVFRLSFSSMGNGKAVAVTIRKVA